MSEVHRRLIAFLDDHRVEYQCLEHAPTRTSAESAQIRGTPLSAGAKALVMKLGKGDGGFALFVLGADMRANSKAIRSELGVRKSRFATREELAEQTGLVPGSVPPFGPPVLPLPLHVDRSLLEGSEVLAFNAGSLTRSVIMATADYLRIAQATIFDFSDRA